MADFDGRSCRIHDGDRGSMTLWDNLSQIDRKFEVAERVFPRPRNGKIIEIHTRSNNADYSWRRKDDLKDSSLINQQIHAGFTFSGSHVFKSEIKLLTFDGSSLTVDFLDWIDTLEDYFETSNPPDALQCKLAASKLKGEARAWWKELQNHRILEGKNSITSWPRMRKLLIEKFLHTSCLTYFHKQENKLDVMHTNCSTICPSQCLKVEQEENESVQEENDSVDRIKDDEYSEEKVECNEGAGMVINAKLEKGVKVVELQQADGSTLTKCSTEVPSESFISKWNEVRELEILNSVDVNEAVKLKLDRKLTFMNNRQLPIVASVLSQPFKGFWESIYASNISSNIQLEEMVWLTRVVAILKLYLDGNKHMTSLIFSECMITSYLIDEIALLSFDPGGITYPSKTRNSVSLFCPKAYALFANDTVVVDKKLSMEHEESGMLGIIQYIEMGFFTLHVNQPGKHSIHNVVRNAAGKVELGGFTTNIILAIGFWANELECHLQYLTVYCILIARSTYADMNMGHENKSCFILTRFGFVGVMHIQHYLWINYLSTLNTHSRFDKALNLFDGMLLLHMYLGILNMLKLIGKNLFCDFYKRQSLEISRRLSAIVRSSCVHALLLVQVLGMERYVVVAGDGGTPNQEAVGVVLSHRISAYFNLTRRRVIPLEGWNDEKNSNQEENFIMTAFTMITIFTCLSILWDIGKFKKTSKMFHKVVNGLDPPMDLDGACLTSTWSPTSSLEDELFEERDGVDVGYSTRTI